MKKLFSIDTWNLSECISSKWTFENGVNELSLENYEIIEKKIIDYINSSEADAICFQEFPIMINNKTPLLDAITNRTQFEFHAEIDTSPSFLFTGGRIGVAIFSKKKIKSRKTFMFNNPNLSIRSQTGKVYHSFDKGIITINIDESYSIITCHGISFARFSKNPKHYPDTFRPLRDEIFRVLESNKEVIVIGDLNADDIVDIFPELSNYIEDKLLGSTTIPGYWGNKYYEEGRKMDCIYVSKKITVINIKKIKNFSDHYICSCKCEINC